MPNSYPAIVADMLSDAIGCIGFSWIASPACTGQLIFLCNKKKYTYTRVLQLKLKFICFLMAEQNQITFLFRIGNGDDGLVGENVGPAGRVSFFGSW